MSIVRPVWEAVRVDFTVPECVRVQNERGLRWFAYRLEQPVRHCFFHNELAGLSLDLDSVGLQDDGVSLTYLPKIWKKQCSIGGQVENPTNTLPLASVHTGFHAD